MPDPRADIRALIDRRGPARAPDFFCIGSEKCGTTWLWEMLRDHPDVGVPLPKELRYFASIHIGTGLSNFNALRRLLTNHAKTPRRREFLEKLATELRVCFGGDEAYLRIFGAMPQRVVGEISPQYCALPDEGIAHMRLVAPDARIILLMRDPVDRALSGAKMKTAEQDGELSDEAIRQRAFHPFQLRLSRYSDMLDRFEAAFPDRVFTGFFDDLISDPHGLLQGICTFLGVDYAPRHFPRVSKVANEGKKYRVSPAIRRDLMTELAGEYDRLEQRFPERVAAWRARNEELLDAG